MRPEMNSKSEWFVTPAIGLGTHGDPGNQVSREAVSTLLSGCASTSINPADSTHSDSL
jgi:hypothetical protein